MNKNIDNLFFKITRTLLKLEKKEAQKPKFQNEETDDDAQDLTFRDEIDL